MDLFDNRILFKNIVNAYGIINRQLLQSNEENNENIISDNNNNNDINDNMSSTSQRLYDNSMRTLSFLTMFGIFAILYCTLSCYIYSRPNDSQHGTSLVSKIRKIPFLKWFFRAPISTSYKTVPQDEADVENPLKEHSEDKESTDTKSKDDEEEPPPDTKVSEAQTGSTQNVYLFGSANLTLTLCAILLLLAYLTWGFMQERIMGHPYGDENDESNWFKSSEFCVLINRLFGVVVSTVALKFTGKSGRDCPPFYYSLCALSNMMSSWFQYEALHYVTFPVQTIFKSSKVLITMAVGKCMGKTFPIKKYLNAAVIGIGVYIFLDAQRRQNLENNDSDDSSNSLDNSDNITGYFWYLGLILIIGYAFADAFTSNWQSKVFNSTKVSPLEMMQGVNVFTFCVSFLFCFSSFPYILTFYTTHREIIFHTLLMGLCAGFGQVVIFFTISTFGAVKFATVMTTRMVISVIISIITFGHTLSTMGMVGMVITFIALFYAAFAKGGKKENTKK